MSTSNFISKILVILCLGLSFVKNQQTINATKVRLTNFESGGSELCVNWGTPKCSDLISSANYQNPSLIFTITFTSGFSQIPAVKTYLHGFHLEGTAQIQVAINTEVVDGSITLTQFILRITLNIYTAPYLSEMSFHYTASAN